MNESHDQELKRYQSLLGSDESTTSPGRDGLQTVPLLGWDVKRLMDEAGVGLTQYAVSGHDPTVSPMSPILLNTNAPWSFFLCGSQGSGKSHALSCLLENCLLTGEAMCDIGRNPYPLAGLVFHYDRSQSSGICEAAYLCNKMPVRVLVSRSNYGKLKQDYDTMAENLGEEARIDVQPLDLRVSHLNTERMKALMAIGKAGEGPLYISVSS